MTRMMQRFNPTSELRNLQREVDRVFDRFFTGDDESGGRVWSPPMDLAETDDTYRLFLDVPGIRKDDLEINFQNNTLTVRGTRSGWDHDENATLVRSERATGDFFRSITLPESIEAEDIEAEFDNGVLTIHVPKTEKSITRQIEIQ